MPLSIREKQDLNTMCSSAFNIKLGNVIDRVKQAPIPEGTPVNAKAADATITFSDSVSNGEKVIIGDDTYEFDTDSDTEEGNIAVDVSGGATASDAATALNTAINDNTTEAVTAEEESESDAVKVTYDIKGKIGNDINVSTDVTNASWDEDSLTGGVNGTEGIKFQQYVDEDYLYVSTDENTINDANWKRASISSY